MPHNHSSIPTDVGDPLTDLPMRRPSGVPLSPERVLLEEILFRTADDIRKYPTHSEIYTNAATWVQMRDSEMHGFAWVCAYLGLDTDAAARALLAGRIYRPKRRTMLHQRINLARDAKGRIKQLAATRRAENG